MKTKKILDSMVLIKNAENVTDLVKMIMNVMQISKEVQRQWKPLHLFKCI